MKNISLLTMLLMLCSLMGSTTGCKKEKKEDPPKVWPTTVTDIEGNIYKTCRIGDQLWMAENLRVAHFRNGDPIPTADTNMSIVGVIKAVYQWITKYDTALLKDLGRVYTWDAANHSKGTCPTGWRIPDTTDVGILKRFLGENPGDKLKAADYTYWNPSVLSFPTNETGFTAYGGGLRGAGSASWGGWKNVTHFHTTNYPSTMTLNTATGHLEMSGSAGLNTSVHIRCIME
jgi:uncharacterized protein (TIGR02145 family)